MNTVLPLADRGAAAGLMALLPALAAELMGLPAWPLPALTFLMAFLS